MAIPKTEKELADLGRKVLEQNEKGKLRGKARAKALQRLISANQDQFDTFLEEEKRKLGVK
jgi:hypothetical protein